MSTKRTAIYAACAGLVISLFVSPWFLRTASALATSPPSTATTTTTAGTNGANESEGVTNGGTTVFPTSRSTSRIEVDTQQAEAAKLKADQVRADAKQNGDVRLDAAKLKICQNRQTTINDIMNRIATRGQVQVELFNQIFTNTQTFVKSKNISVTGYDQSLSDIATKKTAAQAAVSSLTTDKAGFNCNTNVLGMVRVFQADADAQNQSLRVYQNAIQVLLDTVKTAAGETK